MYFFEFWINDPIEQFSQVSLFWTHIACPSQITSLTIFLVFNLFFIHFLFTMNYTKENYNTWTWISQNMFLVVKNIIKTNTLLKRYEYFSILLFLFWFIFISNLVGLIPYSFTLTSSFIVTFFLAASHFIGINIVGIAEHRWRITNLFLPTGVPVEIALLLIPIEFISYLARVFSLSIRLFANMMSGHALLKILTGFAWILFGSSIVYSGIAIFPWIIVTIIMFLELLIAFLQAYVFVILIAIYINDVTVLH